MTVVRTQTPQVIVIIFSLHSTEVSIKFQCMHAIGAYLNDVKETLHFYIDGSGNASMCPYDCFDRELWIANEMRLKIERGRPDPSSIECVQFTLSLACVFLYVCICAMQSLPGDDNQSPRVIDSWALFTVSKAIDWDVYSMTSTGTLFRLNKYTVCDSLQGANNTVRPQTLCRLLSSNVTLCYFGNEKKIEKSPRLNKLPNYFFSTSHEDGKLNT